MVQQAARVARELGITREEQDGWALRSHAARRDGAGRGLFAEEIVPVGEVTADESIRRDTTLERLAVAEAGDRSRGDDTAGNAPGVNDGASCVVVVLGGVREAARAGAARDGRRAGLRRGRVRVARAHAGECGRAGAREGRQVDRGRQAGRGERGVLVGRAQLVKMLGADPETVNVNGGAVALGHPIGASGGRILGTMVHELRRNGGGLGLAAICSGGGQGDALLIEV